MPTWQVINRESLPGYTDYGSNAERMGAIGKVFPALQGRQIQVHPFCLRLRDSGAHGGLSGSLWRQSLLGKTMKNGKLMITLTRAEKNNVTIASAPIKGGKLKLKVEGHDHTYARTYQLTSDGKQYDDFAEYKVGQHGQDHKVLDNKLNSSIKFGFFFSKLYVFSIHSSIL